MRWLVGDLVVGEAERDQAGGDVSLIAQAIARLLGGRTVVAEAVRLDDEAQFGPAEIDLESLRRCLVSGGGRPMAAVMRGRLKAIFEEASGDQKRKVRRSGERAGSGPCRLAQDYGRAPRLADRLRGR